MVASPPWTSRPKLHSPVDRVHGFFRPKIIPENLFFLFFSGYLQKAHGTSNLHNFSTTTPNPVILSPKFSKSLPLSFCVFK
jgi:hypothetical protein